MEAAGPGRLVNSAYSSTPSGNGHTRSAQPFRGRLARLVPCLVQVSPSKPLCSRLADVHTCCPLDFPCSSQRERRRTAVDLGGCTACLPIRLALVPSGASAGVSDSPARHAALNNLAPLRSSCIQLPTQLTNPPSSTQVSSTQPQPPASLSPKHLHTN